MLFRSIAKGIIKVEEWDDLRDDCIIDYHRDNHFSELKDIDMINGRLAALQQIDPFAGKYYSRLWIQKNILRLSEEEIEEIETDIEDETKEGYHQDEDGETTK